MKKQRKARLELHRETIRHLGGQVSGGTGTVVVATDTISLCETVATTHRTITVCPSVYIMCGTLPICFPQEPISVVSIVDQDK